MISPNLVRRFVIPGAKMLTEQAHSYGLKVIYHSCGSIAEIIPDLFEAGVDAIHPVQALAEGMNLENIKKKFGDMGAFCGAIDTQELLVKGTAEEIRKQVQKARELFLQASSFHQAMKPYCLIFPCEHTGAV